jgi:hypothetical protein
MTSVYSEPISDVEVEQQAENACREMRVKPGIFQIVRTAYEKKIVKLGWCAWKPHTAVCCTDNTNIPYLSKHRCLDI